MQKTVSDNKHSLLASATVTQDLGDQVSVAGGVAATPGAMVAAGGKLASLTGLGIEVAVEAIAGDGKNAAITAVNESMYETLGAIGARRLISCFPVQR